LKQGSNSEEEANELDVLLKPQYTVDMRKNSYTSDGFAGDIVKMSAFKLKQISLNKRSKTTN
jgi:hypothetical protein